MRRFNPERELRKIQHGSRNKVIIGVVVLLIILGISSSYALYQVRYSKRIIYTKVAPFSNKDINIAVYIDNKNVTNFPKKEDGKVYDKIECDDNKDNHVKAYFDSDTWNLEVDTNDKAKCNVYFKTPEKYQDTSGANPPEIYQGLIPVKYEDTNEDGIPEIIVADTTKEWYNYNKGEWANAVLINNENSTLVADFSGNGNYGKIVGGAQITSEGLVLDGVDDGVYLDNMVKDLFKHSNTIQIKFKKSYVNNRDTLISNYISPAIPYVHYEIDTTNQHRIYWSERTYFGGNYTSNSFVTMTYVYDSEEHSIKIYTDDELVYTATDNSIFTTNMDFSNAYIGRNQTQTGNISSVLDGVIEKVMIYDEILNEEQIKHNFNTTAGKVGGDGVIEDKLHLYYDFRIPQTINATPGKALNMDAISQMYVWVPRYKYQLFNAEAKNVSNERMINIKFEHNIESTGEVTCKLDSVGVETCNNAINGNWYTHPAFTFGNTQLKGIWVGKFEPSDESDPTGSVLNKIGNIEIKPDKIAINSKTMKVAFEATREIESVSTYGLLSSEIDTHVMKNSDWGAMVYLTYSKYGRCLNNSCEEVTTNLVDKTGYASASTQYWYTNEGVKASTTGNVYGIYDAAGSYWECMMSVMVNTDGTFYSSASGFNEKNPEISSRYYELYANGSEKINHERGHLGDATREILKVYGNENGGWYGASSNVQYGIYSWIYRSGASTEFPNMLTFFPNTGLALKLLSFRVVLTAQDGNE